MKGAKKQLLPSVLCAISAAAMSQGVAPESMSKLPTDAWPTYSGDYSGQRYSPLAQIDRTNVKNLTLAWVNRVVAGSGSGGGGLFAPAGPPTIVGGEAAQPVILGMMGGGGPARIVGAILQVDGVLYLSSPDNAWAVDARDGTVLWHYFWKTKGGSHIGNRGMGMYRNWLYFETPDDYVVSLDAKTGKERWHKPIADLDEQYFSTMAPIVIGRHVLVGTGNDLDFPGFLQSFDPETGELQWKSYTVPMKQGDLGLNTWPSLDRASHGGGQVWTVGAYDPETHLYIFGTGNPTPAYTPKVREGDNLFTCSLVAVNVDTGKMAWYYQTSPHDTHDWDSAQTPILADLLIKGVVRKVILWANRNGFYYVLDRVTGEFLTGVPFVKTDWANGLTPAGRPILVDAAKVSTAGRRTSPGIGASNWQNSAFDQGRGSIFVAATESSSVFSKRPLNEVTSEPHGYGLGSGWSQVELPARLVIALDAATGSRKWQYRESISGRDYSGLLATGGGLVFGASGGSLFALDADNGHEVFKQSLGGATMSPPISFTIDGEQVIAVAAGRALFVFGL